MLDYRFSCPYCGVDLSAEIDASGGTKQSFIQDCEVCCRPIQITLRMQGNEMVEFKAEVE